MEIDYLFYQYQSVIKMARIFFFLVILLLGLFALNKQTASGAAIPSNKEILEKTIAEYLKHDPQLIEELKELQVDSLQSEDQERYKRQSEVDEAGNDANSDGKPGFFDRAAKFVVEVLQRFLRWINTENS